MLNSFPPGGAPTAINRQLPQGLTVPGLQQQVVGQDNPFGTPAGGSLYQPAGLTGAIPPSIATMGQQPPTALGTPPPDYNPAAAQSGGMGNTQAILQALTKPGVY